MTQREQPGNWVFRRPGLLAAFALPLALLLGLFIVSQRHWQERIAGLERANMDLQLQELARGLAAESEALIECGRELAFSDSSLQPVQDSKGAGASRPQIATLSRCEVNKLLVVTAARAVRFSASVDGDRLIEGPPDPELTRFLESAAAATAVSGVARAPASASFAGNQLLVAVRIDSRAVPASVIGWLVLERSISAAMMARLAQSVGGSLTGRSPRQLGSSAMFDNKEISMASPFADRAEVTTRLSRDRSSGEAILRDLDGKPAWVLQLQRGPAADARAAGPWRLAGALTSRLAGLLAILAAAIIAAAIFTLVQYFRNRRSVDARYKAIIDQTDDGIVIVDSATHQVLYTNPAFLARLSYTGAEARTLKLLDIFADGGSPAEKVLARLRDANSQSALNMQLRCKSGALIDIETRCNALDVDGRDVLAYVTHDVSVRRKVEQQLIENQQRLDRMAHHDQLTGLPNRHYLATFLPEAIAAAKEANSLLGVVFLDLDRFKHINDTRGHETGDKLLQEVAGRLRACVRDTDVVVRMGGDEFVVVFPNVKSYDEVTLGAGRIIETLDKPILIDAHPLQTTGSVGVSLYPQDGADMGELLKHSDTAMYQAKERGRNNVQMFSQIMNRKLKHRVAMEASLREALRLKQLDVHYQPFVNLVTRKVVGLEALMRWRHPVHGMIPADQFIPVAEETGLIVPMGNFVLHRTLQTMSAWRKAGVPLVPISLNVAPAQLQRGELQSTIAKLLKTHGLGPELLQLEMTERALFDSSQAKAGEIQQDTMARLRDFGIKIAIDDFGTGYSSLSYLKNWRVDALKIDRSFVRDLVTDSSDLAIVSAIIAIARHMHIQVIAEGIEGYQQAEILRKLGCTVGQGFLFAKPMPADECLELLGDNAVGTDEVDDMLAVFATGRA